MDLLQNDYVLIAAGAVLFVMSELIAASKLKDNSVTGLVMSFLKLVIGKK